MKTPTYKRLAEVLAAEGLVEMAGKARQCYYDDYRSPLATPIVQLYLDLMDAKRPDLAERAANGEWDGTREEGEEWLRGQGHGLLRKWARQVERG